MDNIWRILILWGLVYLSDYTLTIYGAGLYRRYARQYLVFEGSYELNPIFQKEVDALRRISPRFIAAWIISLALIYFAWGLSNLIQNQGPFEFLVGGLLLTEIAVHVRHIRNIALFRLLKQPGLVQGKIVYSRRLSLRLSSIELLGFTAIYLIGWLLTGSQFFMGGVLACLVTAVRHWLYAHRSPPSLPDSTQAAAPTQDVGM